MPNTSQKIKPITEEDLLNIFRGENFRRLLIKSALHTFNEGHESGFLIVRDLQNRLHYSGLVKGTTEAIPEIKEAEISSFGKEEENEDIYTVLHLHFHPDISDCVCPSGELGDLGGFNSLRKYKRVNCKPLGVVGQIDPNREGELILVQEKSDNPLDPSLIEETMSRIKDLSENGYRFTKYVVNTFNETRLYKAASLTFKLYKNKVIIPDDELQRVKIFAYTPTLKPKED